MESTAAETERARSRRKPTPLALLWIAGVLAGLAFLGLRQVHVAGQERAQAERALQRARAALREGKEAFSTWRGRGDFTRQEREKRAIASLLEAKRLYESLWELDLPPGERERVEAEVQDLSDLLHDVGRDMNQSR